MPNLAMPQFADPTDPGTVWIWDAESKSYIKAPDNGLGPDRGHSTGGDNDLFNQNQIEHSELAGVPELEGHMGAVMHGLPGIHNVVCPMCQESTDQGACPTCGKDLTPEWNKKGDADVYHDQAPQEHHLDGMPEREPKRNRMKTDDTYPSMNLSRYEMAVKIANRTVTADEWENMFGAGQPAVVEVGKWLQDKNGQLFFEHGVHALHERLAERNGIPYPQGVGALGSVFNNGTAETQKVEAGYQFDLAATQQQLDQAFGGHYKLTPPLQRGDGQARPTAFQPFEITTGQWIVDPTQATQPVTGTAWVKESPQGQYRPNQILVAEHLQPDDFMLYSQGARAIITATGGVGSHAAQLAQTMGIPVIVGVGEPYTKIETGNYLKIEPTTHTITVMPGPTGEWSPEDKQQSWNLIQQYQQQRGGHVTSKPEYFAHIDEELAWRLANDATLDSCPECHSPMIRQASESVCHSCGHKQPTITVEAGMLAPALMGAGRMLAPALLGGGEGAAAGAGAGGMGGLMTKALQGGAFQVGKDMVPGGGNAPSPGASMAQPMQGPDTSQVGLVSKTADTFGEEEDGWATKNRGEDSNPDYSGSSPNAGMEKGDSPEQLKDVDGIGGPKSSDGTDAEKMDNHGDPEMQDKAMKAFHLNLPLVMEFADSDEAGMDNPILRALDELLEEAFPGYKDGHDQENGATQGDENPLLEAAEEVTGEDLDDDDEEGESEEHKEKVEDDGDEDDKQKANEVKSASLWGFLGSDEDDVTEHEPDCHCDECDASRESIKEAGMNPMMAQPNGLQATPGIGQNPTCPLCGQSHIAGTPCPDSGMLQQQMQQQQQMVQPGTASGPISPMQPTKVITHEKLANWIHEADYHGDMDFPGATCPACGSPGVEIGAGQFQCQQCGVQFGDNDQAQVEDRHLQAVPDMEQFNPYAESDDANEAYERGMYSSVAPVDDAEFSFFAANEDHVQPDGVGASQQPHHLHHPDRNGVDDWVDDQGAPMQEGQEYEMKTGNHAIPDRVKVERVLPDKITYTVDSGDVTYRHELTKQQVDTDGVTFTSAAPADQIVDSADGFQDQEDPIRPGQDPTPQVTDISTPSTVHSTVSDSKPEIVGLDNYTGSFTGDATEARTWLLEGTSTGGVDVDPALMAKLAGKDYDAREQRAFIDEPGEARNLDRLDLEGTHYITDETDDHFNWS